MSILRRVAGCLWSYGIKVGCMPMAVFKLLKVPHVSDSAAEDTTLQIVLYSVWIGPFLLLVGFTDRGKGQSLR